MTVFENYPFDDEALTGSERAAGLDVRGVGGRDATHYPLTLAITLQGGRLRLVLKHRPDLYDTEAAHHILELLTRALDHLAHRPQTLAGRVDIASDATALAETGRPAAYGDGPGCAATVAAFAAAEPDTVAVRTLGGGGETVSYGRLAARAAAFAELLRETSAGPEAVVAVLLPRSVELVTTELAVAWAGAVCLPLHPDWPAERVRTVLAASGAVALVCLPGAERAAYGPLPTVHPPVGDPETTTAGAWPPPAGPAPDRLAYVMYTSGSTGEPKGVAVPESAVLALASDSRFTGAAHRRTLVHSPHSFDAATHEIWGTLLRGGELVLAPDGPLDPARWRELLTRDRERGGEWTPPGSPPGSSPSSPRTHRRPSPPCARCGPAATSSRPPPWPPPCAPHRGCASSTVTGRPRPPPSPPPTRWTRTPPARARSRSGSPWTA